MAGFLSSERESNIENLYNTLHATFAKTIKVYKDSQKTIISTSPNFNPIYGRTNTGSRANANYTEVSQEFEARVYYIKSDEEYLSNSGGDQSGTQNKIIMPDGSVKIVVKSDAYRYIEEAKKVEFDGKRFNIKSDGNPDGLTSNQFYTFFLTPIDES